MTHGPVARGANLLVVPALAVLVVFTVIPFVHGIGLSLTDWDGYSAERAFIGIDNYVRMLTDPMVGTALANTLIFGLGSALVQQVLGLALALALDRAARRRGISRTVARAIIYLPVLVSPVVLGSMYYFVFAYSPGGLNDFVVALGGEPVAWLSEPGAAIAIIVLVNSLQFVGISMVIYLAGLQTIPAMYREAAVLDGASGAQRFLHVILPLLRPAVAASLILNLIGGLKLFDIIRVLTNGGPGFSTESMSTLISRLYFDSQLAGYASAVGVVLFLLVAVATVVLNLALRRRRLGVA